MAYKILKCPICYNTRLKEYFGRDGFGGLFKDGNFDYWQNVLAKDKKYCAELRCFYDKKVPKIKAVGELCNTKGENADKFFIFCKCGYHSFDYQDFLKYNEYNDKLIGK